MFVDSESLRIMMADLGVQVEPDLYVNGGFHEGVRQPSGRGGGHLQIATQKGASSVASDG